MYIQQRTANRMERARLVVIALVLALAAVPMLGSPLVAQESSAQPSPSPTAAEAACSSADDLRLIVDFTLDSVESDSGLVPVLVGTVAGLGEARVLAGLVGEVYRPLVEDLIVTLQDLRTMIGELGDLETAGAKLASVGEAVTDVGNAMDALAIQLRTSCPDIA